LRNLQKRARWLPTDLFDHDGAAYAAAPSGFSGRGAWSAGGCVKQMIRQQIPDWLQVDLLIIVEAISIIGAGIFIAP
jgi:hypothetical protein